MQIDAVVEQWNEVGAHVDLTTSPHGRIKSSIAGPLFIQALAGVRRFESQVKAIDKDDLMEQGNEVGAHVHQTSSPQSRIKLPVAGPSFVLALAALESQIKAVNNDDVIPL